MTTAGSFFFMVLHTQESNSVPGTRQVCDCCANVLSHCVGVCWQGLQLPPLRPLWGRSSGLVALAPAACLWRCNTASLAHRFASSSPQLQEGAPGTGNELGRELSLRLDQSPSTDPSLLLGAYLPPTLLSSLKLTPMNPQVKLPLTSCPATI